MLTELKKITDPALVPDRIVKADKAFTETIEQTSRERDRLRWESTMCPDGEGITFEAYGVSVGHRDGKYIRESAKAWATHKMGCTNPEHASGRKVTVDDMPSPEDHVRARVLARNQGVTGVAQIAVAKAKGISPATISQGTAVNHAKDVKRVIQIANEMAAEAAVEEPDDVMIEAAARELVRQQEDDATLRQRVKKQMMSHRGIVDFKDPRVADEKVAEILAMAEDIASKPHVITGLPVSFEDALRRAFETDATRAKTERAESDREKRQTQLVFELSQLLIATNLKLHQAAKILKLVEVKGIKPEQKARIEANLARTHELLNLLEISVISMEAVDWDKALADLMGEGE